MASEVPDGKAIFEKWAQMQDSELSPGTRARDPYTLQGAERRWSLMKRHEPLNRP